MGEGVAVLPELVAQLEDIDSRVVFVGNQGHGNKERIKRGAKEDVHDWMRLVSDEYMTAFAAFVVRMSEYIEKEAHAYGFDYMELDGKTFGEAVDEVVGQLLES